MTQFIDCHPYAQPVVKPDFAAIKQRQRATWASGDFAVIGTTLQSVGESLCEAAELRAGSTVLDVACGNGNSALAAGRRFCNVTGVDYVPALLERAKDRARAERQTATFIEGDAEQLPFEDGVFDYVLSTFGVMFTADHAQTARELVRVCKPGGKIALASWTRRSFVGDLLRTVARFAPPPPGAASPLRWGTPEALAELFGGGLVVTQSVRKHFVFRYTSGAHFVDVFRRHHGPTCSAFEALDAVKQSTLATDILHLVADYNRDASGGIAVPAEYLETVLEVRR